MNALVMSKHPIAFAIALVATAFTSACNEPQEAPPLQGASIGGYFELVDSHGRTTNWEDFDGAYRMVYFGYAYCPDVCPFDLNRMMLGYRQFAEANPRLATNVQPIFITVDPERDTPERIGKYVSNFGDNLIGLTGTPDQIAQAARAFAVYYARGEEGEDGTYLMDHSRAAYLMGLNGEPIALLPVDKTPEAVAAELDKWIS